MHREWTFVTLVLALGMASACAVDTEPARRMQAPAQGPGDNSSLPEESSDDELPTQDPRDDDAAGNAEGPSPADAPPVSRQPTAISIDLDPGGLVRPGLRLLPVVEVSGEDGAVMDASYTLTVEPGHLVSRLGERYEVIGEGSIVFTACAPTTEYMEGEVCASARTLSDAAPPTIEIDSPTPGAQFFGVSPVAVRGRVVDTHGDVSLFVDGTERGLDSAGRFEVVVWPRFGQ